MTNGDERRSAGAGDGEGDGGVDLPSPTELLATLARLDLEAALVYEAAAELSSDGDVRRKLIGFAGDHRRHVEALDRVLEEEGEAAAEPSPDLPVLAGVVKLTAPLGPEVAVLSLLGTEQLSNLGYDAALAYEWDTETEGLLREFQRHEERHLAWLAERHEQLGREAGEGAPPTRA